MSNFNPQAFPCEQGHTPEGLRNPTYEPGMTLRDYFAAKTLPALIDRAYKRSEVLEVDYIAEDAYRLADAMLEARK